VIVHRCRDLDRTTHNLRLGVPVTNPLRSLVDAGAVLPEEDVKEALLTATGARLITVMGAKAELDRVGRPGRRGAGVLRAILTELGIEGSRAPSVLEAKMRSLINRLDLPEDPVCELVAGENGEYRLDFPFPTVLLDVEVDGWEVHSSDHARRSDLTRQEPTLRARVALPSLHLARRRAPPRAGWGRDSRRLLRPPLRFGTANPRLTWVCVPKRQNGQGNGQRSFSARR
jgi:hypothetical protein